MLVLTFNYVDRVALSIVLQEIKLDLHLTDMQLGFLSGIAFAFFYAVMGIPIARWADRGNRVTIIAVTTGLWSLMVALTGRVAGFVQLFAVRIGVGIGEAGCVPPANSLIPEYFCSAERPRAMGFYLLGGSLSLIIGYLAAGWLNQLLGWRDMFMVIALPGVVLVVLSALTLREPRRRLGGGTLRRECGQNAQTGGRSDPSLTQVVSTLWRNLTFRELLIVFCVIYFFGYGLLQWIPAFFIRSYDYRTGVLGTWLAMTYGLGGLIGTYLGGSLASRYAADREALQFRAVAFAFCALAVIWMGVFLSHNAHVDFALLGIGVLGGATVNGPIFAAVQTLVPDDMRAMAIAVIYFFANLIGMGLGPLAAGALSEALRPYFGQQSLRYALLLLCPGYIWAAWHLWRASATVEADMERVRQLSVRLAETESV